MTAAKVTVRRTGTPSRPWEARCSACREERLHFVDGVGAVAVNTRGIGNRLWVLAMLAAGVHLRAVHPTPEETR